MKIYQHKSDFNLFIEHYKRQNSKFNQYRCSIYNPKHTTFKRHSNQHFTVWFLSHNPSASTDKKCWYQLSKGNK